MAYLNIQGPSGHYDWMILFIKYLQGRDLYNKSKLLHRSTQNWSIIIQQSW